MTSVGLFFRMNFAKLDFFFLFFYDPTIIESLQEMVVDVEKMARSLRFFGAVFRY